MYIIPQVLDLRGARHVASQSDSVQGESMHTLTNIPATPHDKTCTDCGACQRDDGTWYMMGYGPRRTMPPCTQLLWEVENWAGVPESKRSPRRALTTKGAPDPAPVLRSHDHGRVTAHSLRKKW